MVNNTGTQMAADNEQGRSEIEDEDEPGCIRSEGKVQSLTTGAHSLQSPQAPVVPSRRNSALTFHCDRQRSISSLMETSCITDIYYTQAEQ